jgi:sugar-specific transcriptional regulator TrmB
MENSIEQLQQIGLSEAEARVYFALLKGGSARAKEVISATGMYSANVYDALDRLLKRGLASYSVVNGKKFFQASDPRQLSVVLENEKRALAEKEVLVKKIIPEMASLQSQIRDMGKVWVFTGVDGIKVILEDILRVKRDWLLLGMTGVTRRVFGDWVDLYERRRVRLGIRTRVLANNDAQARERAEEFRRLKLTEVRYFPKTFVSPATIYVYGNKTAILVYTKDEPMGVVFDDEKVATGFHNFFELMWRGSA